MYERTPTLAKAWDWLESAYNTASPWIHTAMKIGQYVAPLLMNEETLYDRDSLRLNISRALTWTR